MGWGLLASIVLIAVAFLSFTGDPPKIPKSTASYEAGMRADTYQAVSISTALAPDLAVNPDPLMISSLLVLEKPQNPIVYSEPPFQLVTSPEHKSVEAKPPVAATPSTQTFRAIGTDDAEHRYFC